MKIFQENVKFRFHFTSLFSDPSRPKKRQRLRTARRRTMRPHERPFREWDQSRLARNLKGGREERENSKFEAKCHKSSLHGTYLLGLGV